MLQRNSQQFANYLGSPSKYICLFLIKFHQNYLKGYNWLNVIIGLRRGFAHIRQQAVTWIKSDLSCFN